MKKHTLLAIATLAAACRVTAGDTPAVDYYTERLQLAVAQAVEAVRISAEKNPDNWLYPLPMTRRKVGVQEKQVPARYVEIEEPVYEYEEYEALMPARQSSEGVAGAAMQKVMLKRVKSVIGKRTVRRLVSDKNGPETMTIRVDVWDTDSAVRWGHGMFGATGLLVAALRCSGVPEDDPALQPTLTALSQALDTFGPPDWTWDLAGLTAACTTLSGEDWQRRTLACASKLIDGQLQTGPATGMWGPVSVNPDLLCAILQELLVLSEQRNAVQRQIDEEDKKLTAAGKLKGNRKVVKLEEDRHTLDKKMEELNRLGGWISQAGLRLFRSIDPTHHDPYIRLEEGAIKIDVPCLPYLIHNQTTADLESSNLAIFALRLAAQAGRLPPQSTTAATVAPGMRSKTAFPPPRRLADVLRLANQAFPARRGKPWDDMNLQQPVNNLKPLKSIPLIPEKSLPPLPSETTPYAALRGIATTYNLWQLTQNQFRPFPLSNADFTAALDPLDLQTPAKKTDDDLAHCQTLLSLLPFAQARVNHTPVATDEWRALADQVLKLQQRSGLWGRRDTRLQLGSTSIMARRALLGEDNITHRKLHESYGAMHLSCVYAFKHPTGNAARLEATYLMSAAALLLLSDGLPPGFVCATSGFNPGAAE